MSLHVGSLRGGARAQRMGRVGRCAPVKSSGLSESRWGPRCRESIRSRSPARYSPGIGPGRGRDTIAAIRVAARRGKMRWVGTAASTGHRTHRVSILSEQTPVNPYAPPGAIVADIAPGAVTSARPPAVRWALRLLWVAVAFGAVFTALGPLPPTGSGMSALGVRAIGLAVLAPWTWLVFKMAAGRNWARRTWIVITVLGTLMIVMTPQKLTRMSSFDLASFTLQTTLQLTACVLLLSSQARRWFKPRVSPP